MLGSLAEPESSGKIMNARSDFSILAGVTIRALACFKLLTFQPFQNLQVWFANIMAKLKKTR